VLAVLLLATVRYTVGEYRHHRVMSQMRDIQFRRSDDIDQLMTYLDAALRSEPVAHAFATTRALALGLAWEKGPENGTVTVSDLISAHRQALAVTPGNGQLWALLAHLHSYQGERGQAYLDALRNAFEYGGYDYNTMQYLVILGVADWPHLGCQDRAATVDLLERALEMDDLILARHNAELRTALLPQQVQKVMEHHHFDLDWARRQARACDAG
jgi:cytochrome c-type biogenesis protein CcmH/NrfG